MLNHVLIQQTCSYIRESWWEIYILKGHGNEADFLGFLQKLVPHRSLTHLSSRTDFGFEFAEIFVIEKRLLDSASRGVADSVSRGVDDSPTRRVGE